MKKSNIYLSKLDKGKDLLSSVNLLIEKVWPVKIDQDHLTAIKMHFGEKGNTSFIDPAYVKRVVTWVKKKGILPFLTDTNTLYKGSRSTTPSHLATASEHGFNFESIGAPIVIADGLKGENYCEVSVDKEFCRTVKIGFEIAKADALIILTHFKGHELTGFGGSIKNIGMGCASREGKLSQHSTAAPIVNRRGCTGCSACIKNCAFGAISINEERAFIDPDKCSGCSQCIVVCPEGVINVQWNESTSNVQKKISEHALGALKGKENKFLCMNFLLKITPTCDCFGYNKPVIADDIGILASNDPVAIDQASIDLVNSDGVDRFKTIYPSIDWEIQLSHAETIGLGRRAYKLIEV